MTDPTPSRSPRSTRLVAIVTVAVLLAGVLTAFRDRLPRLLPSRPAATAAPDTVAGDPVERALEIARVDSTKRDAWVEEVPGIDLAAFTPERRERFVRFANAERCTCGCGFTLAACRQYDPSCEVSLPRIERLRDSVLAGRIGSARGLRPRPEAPAPGR